MVVCSQNVNCWNRCEFIRLRIQYGREISKEIENQSICNLRRELQMYYGTEISKEVEYQSIYKSKRHFSLMWEMSFFMFVTEILKCKTTNSVLQQICSQCFLLLFLLCAHKCHRQCLSKHAPIALVFL